MRRDTVIMPSIAVAVSGAIWGMYWIPVRQLDQLGMTPIWTTIIGFGITGLIFLFFFIQQWLKKGRLPWGVFFTGLVIGAAIVLYAVSLVLTEVIKSVLLCYLMPVWSTILGRFMLKETITPYRVIAVIVGLTGAAVILGVGDGIPKISNIGDLLALSAGVVWAYGSIRIKEDQQASVWEQVGAFYIGSAIFAFVFVVFPVKNLAPPLAIETVIDSLFWMFVLVAVYLPSMFLIFWANQIMSPARVGILLMTEIVFGVLSAALYSGEPIGWVHITGTVLIVGAGVIDVSDRLFAGKSSK